MKNRFIQILMLMSLVVTGIVAHQSVLFAAPVQESLKNTSQGAQDGSSIADPQSKAEACKGISGTTDCGDSGFFGNFVTTVVNVLTLVVGGIAVIMLIVGGIRYVTSGGDSNATKGAKDTILYAIIGIIIVASAQLIVRFVISKI